MTQFLRSLFALCPALGVLLVLTADAEAGRGRRGGCSGGGCSGGQCGSQAAAQAGWLAYQPTDGSTATNTLAEVNQQRAGVGLKALIPDPQLQEAASRVAVFRAKNAHEPHLIGPGGDFAGAPAGCVVRATGCCAWPQHLGMGGCGRTDPQYTHAGAACAIGADGRRYCQLFYR